MELTEDVLRIIEHEADKGKNLNLMFKDQILRELGTIRKELQAIRSSLEPKKIDIEVVSRQIQECLTEQIEECADLTAKKV